jgi:hypothetical protein
MGKTKKLGDLVNRGIITSAPLTGGGLLTEGLTLGINQASSIQGGFISSSDWITFNGKQDALGFTPYNATNPAGYITSASLAPLEFNTFDRTVWNNGKGDVETNTSFGKAALRFNGIGQDNTAFGFEALGGSIPGSYNTAIGSRTLISSTSSNNTAVGYSASQDNTTGFSNTAVGVNALAVNTTGGANTAIGVNAGYTDSANASNVICNNSVFIGASSKPLVNNQTNQIVIGANTNGNGSNTATLGNESITITRLRGEVRGGSFVKDGGTSTQFLKADGSVDSNSYALASSLTGYVTLDTTQTITGAKFFTGFLTGLRASFESSGSSNTFAINHTSGSGIALNILKDGNGEGLTIVKGSGSGNAASITGGITLLSELNLTTKLADAHIASAATWNAKIGGSGTTNYLAKFTSSGVVGNSAVFESGGNVGIGTTSPTGLWSGANRNINILSIANHSSELVLSRTAGSNVGAASISNFLSGTTADFGIYTTAALNYVVYTNNVERFRITSDGNVGIGTTSPGQKLTVQHSGDTFIQVRNNTAGQNVFLGATSTDARITNDNSTPFTFYLAGSERMRITSVGNVGINTTNPASKLHVVGLPEYATNALAISGGLTVGAFYHTAGTLKVVI